MHVNQIQEIRYTESKRRNEVNEYSNVAIQVSIE